MEVWKPVKNHEKNYSVSNMGRVRSERSGIILRPQKRSHGYLSVWLYEDGYHEQVSIHRLVADAFCNNPNNFPEVNHKNENKQDNRAENLEWISRIDNVRYGSCQKRRAETMKNDPRISRKIAQYTMDGVLVRIYESLAEAERHGFARGNICRCAQGSSAYSHAYGYIWRYAG